MKHLDDDKIQTYLDLGNDSLTGYELNHLDSCPECRATLEQYRFLARVASEPCPVSLPPDFAHRAAVAAMPGTVTESVGSRIYTVYLPIAATIAAMITWAIIVGKDVFVSTIMSGFMVGYEAVRAPFESLVGLDSTLGEHTGLMVAAGLLLILFGSMDRLIKMARKSRRLMMSI